MRNPAPRCGTLIRMSAYGLPLRCYDNLVYIGSHNYNLYCLNAQTGSKVWEFKTDYYVVASPAVTGDNLYFGSWDNKLYGLNAKTGAKLWEFKLLGSKSSPAVAGGYIYVGGDDHYIYCLKATPGDAGSWPLFKGNAARTGSVPAG